MPVSISGDGTITGLTVGGLPNGVVDEDTIATNAVTTNKILNANVTSGKLASGTGGKVLQVQSNVLTTAYSQGLSSGTTYDIMTCNITPSSGSKVFIQWFIGQMVVTSGTNQIGLYLRRNTTGIGFPTSPGSRRSFTTFAAAWDDQQGDRTKGTSGCWMDLSPGGDGSTAITYRLSVFDGDGGGTIRVNRSDDDTDNNIHARTPSQFVLTEIAA